MRFNLPKDMMSESLVQRLATSVVALEGAIAGDKLHPNTSEKNERINLHSQLYIILILIENPIVIPFDPF